MKKIHVKNKKLNPLLYFSLFFNLIYFTDVLKYTGCVRSVIRVGGWVRKGLMRNFFLFFTSKCLDWQQYQY